MLFLLLNAFLKPEIRRSKRPIDWLLVAQKLEVGVKVVENWLFAWYEGFKTPRNIASQQPNSLHPVRSNIHLIARTFLCMLEIHYPCALCFERFRIVAIFEKLHSVRAMLSKTVQAARFLVARITRLIKTMNGVRSGKRQFDGDSRGPLIIA